jgi:murein DD-endopeptidase MepM/ murein hydrolase activator NlpD
MGIDGLSKPAVPLLDTTLSNGVDRLRNYSAHSSNLPPEKRDEELKKASQEFEALFISYLLKVMRTTVPQSDGEEASTLGKETYLEMFDQEIGLHVARSQSLGIGEMLYRKLSGKDGNKAAGTENQRSSNLKQHLQVDPQSTKVSGVGDSRVRQPSNPLPVSESTESQQPLLELTSPVNGVTSSSFGIRSDPFTHQYQFHQGVDVAAPSGSQIHAAHAGTVIFSGFLSGYGKTVIIEHENGYRTLYAHAAKNLVAVGEKVASQQVIGVVGNTGRSTGSHLHFELEKNGEKLDPVGYLVSSQESTRVKSI